MNGAPAKPISGTVELAGEDAHRLEHVGRVGLGVERAEPVEVGRACGTGCATTGPVPGATSTPKPMAATGTTMSE